MGRKMKKAAIVLSAGMVIGIQLMDLSAVGMSLPAEARNRKKMAERTDFKKNTDKHSGKEENHDSGRAVGEIEEENQDPDKDFEKEGEDKDSGEEDKDKDSGEEDKDKDSGEEDKDKDSEKEDQNQDNEPEEIKLYYAEYNGSDGENGYYMNCPDGKITHRSKRGVTRYLFQNGNGEQQSGILNRVNESCVLKRLGFTDGRNEIEIWMEDEQGILVENSESKKEFWMDSTRPTVRYEVQDGSDIWHKERAEIHVETSDGTNGSQIAEIVCQTGEKVIGKSNKETETFQLEEESKGGEGIPVILIVRDYAGNQTIVSDKIFIDRDIPEVSIQGVQDYMITSKPVQVTYLAEEENGFQNVQAHILKEDGNGRKEETEVTGWMTKRSQESGKLEKESSQMLTGDGIYKIRMDVTDRAGHENHAERQVIIDRENPVIVHVDELAGKYLKYFQWDYTVNETIKDFTSYTYTMKVDDTVYRPGEKIEKEGIHTLVVEAADAAGNKSEAKARFTIDHTPPVIRFENIEEGESYEKERKFYVRTENQDDQIEYIKINGKKQKNEKQKTIYEYKVEEAKAYEVEVKAKDFAGNERISRIGFQVEPEKTFLRRITEPVQKYIFYRNEKVEKEEKQIKEESGKRNDGKRIIWESFTMAGILTGVGFCKREKLKNIWRKRQTGRTDNETV